MRRIAMAAVVLTLAMWQAKGAVPAEIHFQGRLTDGAGTAITAAVDITFTLYDASEGGSSVWTETYSGVTPADGLFTVTLGANVANPLTLADFRDNPRLYLGVQVEADLEMTPRYPVCTSAYAFVAMHAEQAANADTVDGQDASAFASAGHNHLGDTWTGSAMLGLNLQNSGAFGLFVYGATYAAIFDNDIVPDNTNAFSCGTSSFAWSAVYSYAYPAPSDERMKTDVRPIEGALDKVGRMRGVYFRWKDKPGSDAGRQVGVVAQEVEGVLPEVVFTGDDEEGRKSVDYSKMTALLIEAVKELKSENDVLRRRLSALEEAERE